MSNPTHREPLQPIETAAEARSHYGRRGRPDRSYSPFLPLLLLALAAFLWTSFQCYQIFYERRALATLRGNQARQMEESLKLRSSLDVIVRETVLLADRGNSGAKMIVDELRKRGVTIKSNAASVPPPKAER
jgi:hypothetical protein